MSGNSLTHSQIRKLSCLGSQLEPELEHLHMASPCDSLAWWLGSKGKLLEGREGRRGGAGSSMLARTLEAIHLPVAIFSEAGSYSGGRGWNLAPPSGGRNVTDTFFCSFFCFLGDGVLDLLM